MFKRTGHLLFAGKCLLSCVKYRRLMAASKLARSQTQAMKFGHLVVRTIEQSPVKLNINTKCRVYLLVKILFKELGYLGMKFVEA